MGAVAGVYGVHALAVGGRKGPSGGAILAGAAGGCAAGVVFGWGIGIRLEAAVPWVMLAGGEAQLWAGTSIAVARVEAALFGRALVNSTFTGSAITALQNLGVISEGKGFQMFQSLSVKFLSSASSVNVVVGSELSPAKTFFTHELPALLQSGANIAIKFVR